LSKHTNEEDVNSAIENYYQMGTTNTKDDVLLELLVHMLQEPFFSQLRTVEQLGYVVHSGVRRDFNVQGLFVLIQSSEVSPTHMDERIEIFFQQFMNKLENLSDSEYNTHLEALIAKKEEKEKQLARLSVKFWIEINNYSYQFDRMKRDVECLKALQKSELVDFYKRYIVNYETRKKLSVQIFGKGKAIPSKITLPTETHKIIIIENFTKFKRSLLLYNSATS